MSQSPTLKSVLKRGALIAAANWQVTAAQFAAESAFKILVAVPLVGGALLVVLLVGGNIIDLAGGDLRTTVSTITGTLAARPGALVLFLVALAVAAMGGSVLVFFVKGGTVSVLIAADRLAGPVEWGPIDMDAVGRASAFSLERFIGGSHSLFRRYLALGLILLVVYLVSGAAYLAAIFGLYTRGGEMEVALLSLGTGLCSLALVVWIALVNLGYLLTQMAIAADDSDVRTACASVAAFLRARGRQVIAVFLVVFVVVMIATAVSMVGTAALGFISFVPFAGIAVLPLQAAAWLIQGFVFQYLGLTALGAYLAQYRAYRHDVPAE
jgi:hypothetical protein